MKHVIIVFERPDIPAAKLILENFVTAEVWVFDPHLLDDLAIAKISNAQYIKSHVNFDLLKFNDEIQIEALYIGFEIEKIFKNGSLNDTTNYKYWQNLNLHNLLMNIHGYTKLWDSMLTSELDSHHFHIPVYDRAAEYYLPSFLPAIMLLERMIIKDIPFSSYAHSKLNEYSRLLPIINDIQNDYSNYIFIHLPTCIYDAQFLDDELTKLKKSVLVFQSQDWNVNLSSFENSQFESTNLVISKLSDFIGNDINSKIEQIKTFLFTYFKKFLSSDFFINRQINNIAERYRSLLVYFNYLEYKFSTSRPHAIILSSHDAGLHGAFYSFADKYDIKTIIFPHAKIINWPIEKKHTTNLITVSHPIQGGTVQNIDKNKVINLTIKYPENLYYQYKSVNSIKTIGIIINKFSNDGISFVDTNLYLEGLQNIIDWSVKYNIIVKLRLKPGGTCFKWLSDSLNISINSLIENTQITLKDFALTTDLCLMYDAPTSGAIVLLDNSIPLIGVTNRELLPTESAIVSDNIVPSLSITKALELLNTFLNKELNFINFRSEQFFRYFTKIKSSTSLSELC